MLRSDQKSVVWAGSPAASPADLSSCPLAWAVPFSCHFLVQHWPTGDPGQEKDPEWLGTSWMFFITTLLAVNSFLASDHLKSLGTLVETNQTSGSRVWKKVSGMNSWDLALAWYKQTEWPQTDPFLPGSLDFVFFLHLSEMNSQVIAPCFSLVDIPLYYEIIMFRWDWPFPQLADPIPLATVIGHSWEQNPVRASEKTWDL